MENKIWLHFFTFPRSKDKFSTSEFLKKVCDWLKCLGNTHSSNQITPHKNTQVINTNMKSYWYSILTSLKIDMAGFPYNESEWNRIRERRENAEQPPVYHSHNEDYKNWNQLHSANYINCTVWHSPLRRKMSSGHLNRGDLNKCLAAKIIICLHRDAQ